MEWLLVGRWLLTLGVLTAVGAPLAAWLFPRLPRRGAAFALPVALLTVAVVVFLLGQITFGLETVIAGIVVTALASALASRTGARPDWSAVGRLYLVFAAGFIVLVAIRAARPTITPGGGEQFLHFGLVQALARSPALPPEDVWFAGEPLRYYYGTQLQVTSLSLVTGTPLRYGFNLGIATFYGVLVVSAYGLAGAVSAAAGRSYRLGGVLGAFFAAAAGHLTTAIRFLHGLLPDGLAVDYGHAAFGFAAQRSGHSYPGMVDAMSDPQTWTWWYTRYVVPGTLQEVPLYSFVKADLHGHALSTGYVVVAAALVFSYYRLPAKRRRRRLAVLVGGLGGVAGVFGFMNTWALPTAVGLAWLAAASADAHPATLLPRNVADRVIRHGTVADELARLGLAVVPALAVGAVGLAVASPFLLSGLVPENGGVGLFPPRSPLTEFLVVYGGLVALVAGFVWYRGWPAVRNNRWRVVAFVSSIPIVLSAAALAGATVLALTAALILGCWWLVRTGRAGFESVLLVAGVGLLLSMEVVFARVAPWPSGPARWNTSLKVAVQGWTLAAVGAGGVAAIVLSDARAALASVRAPVSEGQSTATDGGAGANGALLAGTLVVAVVLASSVFPAMAAGVELGSAVTDGERFTLDGLAAHEQERPEELAALRWLEKRDGRPTVVEAPGRAYQWTSIAATTTGLPGVVGWTHHQENYRPDDRVAARVAAVERIYTGEWSRAAATLAEYDVAYVYVGPVARERYGDALRSFAGRPGLSVAYETDAVTIYRVDQNRLDG
jgi:YYY domain-containing protein